MSNKILKLQLTVSIRLSGSLYTEKSKRKLVKYLLLLKGLSQLVMEPIFAIAIAVVAIAIVLCLFLDSPNWFSTILTYTWVNINNIVK